MIQAGDFRKGTTFEMDGDVWQIVDFQHVKPGKGAAFVRTKIKSVMTGANRDMTFNPNDKYPEARIETKEMQYLYNDGEFYYFMDPDTYEQLPVSQDSIEDAMQYIKDNDMAIIKFYQGKPFRVDPQNFVELIVTQTEPGIKGNTATGATKPATLETGATVNVPLFINEGDKLKIDTRTGEYLSRV
ncbi:MAG: elongation factor P [Finegoldia sp.]|nr:elongation factor P [Finegoldia sp.]